MNKFIIKRMIACILILTLLPVDGLAGCFTMKVSAEEAGGTIQAEIESESGVTEEPGLIEEETGETPKVQAESALLEAVSAEDTVSGGDSFIDNSQEKEEVVWDNCGFVLEKDLVINGDYSLTEGTLNLDGHTLTIEGDFIQAGGEVVLNEGQLIIEGDYRMQSRTGEEGNYTYGKSDGKLSMTYPNDYLFIKGSYISATSTSKYGQFDSRNHGSKGRCDSKQYLHFQ